MKNKRGQMFSLILVFITLFMVGVSISVYMIQQKGVQNSLVSPLAVLNVRDARAVFDMREKSLILNSLEKTKGAFGSEVFLQSFRNNFISGITPSMKEFIFANLSWNGQVLKDFNRESFLKNVVYGEAGFRRVGSGGIILERGRIGKSFELRALDKYKTNFAVDFDYNFNRKYLIKKVGGKFLVEVVK